MNKHVNAAADGRRSLSLKTKMGVDVNPKSEREMKERIIWNISSVFIVCCCLFPSLFLSCIFFLSFFLSFFLPFVLLSIAFPSCRSTFLVSSYIAILNEKMVLLGRCREFGLGMRLYMPVV